MPKLPAIIRQRPEEHQDDVPDTPVLIFEGRDWWRDLIPGSQVPEGARPVNDDGEWRYLLEKRDGADPSYDVLDIDSVFSAGTKDISPSKLNRAITTWKELRKLHKLDLSDHQKKQTYLLMALIGICVTFFVIAFLSQS